MSQMQPNAYNPYAAYAQLPHAGYIDPYAAAYGYDPYAAAYGFDPYTAAAYGYGAYMTDYTSGLYSPPFAVDPNAAAADASDPYALTAYATDPNTVAYALAVYVADPNMAAAHGYDPSALAAYFADPNIAAAYGYDPSALAAYLADPSIAAAYGYLKYESRDMSRPAIDQDGSIR